MKSESQYEKGYIFGLGKMGQPSLVMLKIHDGSQRDSDWFLGYRDGLGDGGYYEILKRHQAEGSIPPVTR